MKLRRDPTSIAIADEDEEEDEEESEEAQGVGGGCTAAGPAAEEKNGGVDLGLRISSLEEGSVDFVGGEEWRSSGECFSGKQCERKKISLKKKKKKEQTRE